MCEAGRKLLLRRLARLLLVLYYTPSMALMCFRHSLHPYGLTTQEAVAKDTRSTTFF
jgi:hypothetical protein